MALFFLIPLFTGLIGGYIFLRRCSDEVGYLFGIFAAICLIFSLVLAPWQILLLLLVFVLITTQNFLQQVENNNQNLNHKDKKEPLDAKHKMGEETVRKYRGISY